MNPDSAKNYYSFYVQDVYVGFVNILEEKKECKAFVTAKHPGFHTFFRMCREIVEDFDAIPITDEKKPKVLTGISRVLKNSTVFIYSFLNQSMLSSGLHTTIISCFSN